MIPSRNPNNTRSRILNIHNKEPENALVKDDVFSSQQSLKNRQDARLKHLLSTGDEKLPIERERMRLLISESFPEIYSINVSPQRADDIIYNFSLKMIKKEIQPVEGLLSIYSLPGSPNTIYIEVVNSNISSYNAAADAINKMDLSISAGTIDVQILKESQVINTFCNSTKLAYLKKGQFVRLTIEEFSKEIAQIVSINPEVHYLFVRFLPHIDYKRMKIEKISSQKVLNRKSEPGYKAPRALFHPTRLRHLNAKLDESTVSISEDEISKCIKYDGEYFIGHFQFIRVSISDIFTTKLFLTEEETKPFIKEPLDASIEKVDEADHNENSDDGDSNEETITTLYDAIQKRIESPPEPSKPLDVGDVVIVNRGKFTGVPGVVFKKLNNDLLVNISSETLFTKQMSRLTPLYIERKPGRRTIASSFQPTFNKPTKRSTYQSLVNTEEVNEETPKEEAAVNVNIPYIEVKRPKVRVGDLVMLTNDVAMIINENEMIDSKNRIRPIKQDLQMLQDDTRITSRDGQILHIGQQVCFNRGIYKDITGKLVHVIKGVAFLETNDDDQVIYKAGLIRDVSPIEQQEKIGNINGEYVDFYINGVINGPYLILAHSDKGVEVQTPKGPLILKWGDHGTKWDFSGNTKHS